jgi:heme-degrading monooxygenase HmoA
VVVLGMGFLSIAGTVSIARMRRQFKREGGWPAPYRTCAAIGSAYCTTAMKGEHAGEIAVIFVSQRTADDADGYAGAAAAMEPLAARQPGYRGIASARDAGGFGITVSYWADEASAKAWRDHPEHERIRALGRARWYDSYEVVVGTVTRRYDWRRA